MSMEINILLHMGQRMKGDSTSCLCETEIRVQETIHVMVNNVNFPISHSSFPLFCNQHLAILVFIPLLLLMLPVNVCTGCFLDPVSILESTADV